MYYEIQCNVANLDRSMSESRLDQAVQHLNTNKIVKQLTTLYWNVSYGRKIP